MFSLDLSTAQRRQELTDFCDGIIRPFLEAPEDPSYNQAREAAEAELQGLAILLREICNTLLIEVLTGNQQTGVKYDGDYLTLAITRDISRFQVTYACDQKYVLGKLTTVPPIDYPDTYFMEMTRTGIADMIDAKFSQVPHNRNGRVNAGSLASLSLSTPTLNVRVKQPITMFRDAHLLLGGQSAEAMCLDGAWQEFVMNTGMDPDSNLEEQLSGFLKRLRLVLRAMNVGNHALVH